MNLSASTQTPAIVMPHALTLPTRGERVVIGIGEYAVTTSADAAIVTHALGSCVVKGESLGGTDTRTVSLLASSGRVQVTRGREVVEEL